MPTLGNKVSNLVQSALIKVLTFQVGRIADEARRLAKTHRIKENIEVLPVEVSGSVLIATIRVDASETTGAPEALAYEYGSGIWGKKGEKYPIYPKKAGGKLAFDWPAAANIGSREGVRDIVTPVTPIAEGRFEGGRAILPSVMHPGVKAEPYLAPAIEKYEKDLISSLADVSAKALADVVISREVIFVK